MSFLSEKIRRASPGARASGQAETHPANHLEIVSTPTAGGFGLGEGSGAIYRVNTEATEALGSTIAQGYDADAGVFEGEGEGGVLVGVATRT